MRKNIRLQVSASAGEVGAILERPDDARRLLVLGHGAGAGMTSNFMEAIARELAFAGVATFRYQFPYAERGGRRPDPQPLLLATVRSAVSAARELEPDLGILAGGKSMGGRMTSLAAPLPGVKGIVFFGFPLHPPGRPSASRAGHLFTFDAPLLFLQGTRDAFADLTLLEPICAQLGDRATLQLFEGADHSFRVPKKTKRGPDEIMRELAQAAAAWADRLAER